MTDDDTFPTVLPSNCQPGIYENNTAASYSTYFHTPKELNDEFEVALKDLSFVNTIMTFKNEKISVSGMVEDVVIDTLHCKDLEDPKHLVAYNLKQHANEWELAMNASSESDAHKKVLRARLIFNILHRFLSHIFWFAVTNDGVYMRVNTKDKSRIQNYGIYFSEHLKELLNLGSQLIVQKNYFPNMDDHHIKHYIVSHNAPSMNVGWGAKGMADWKRDKRLHIMLLPFHRMVKKVIVIEENKNIALFIDDLNKEMQKYGLVGAVNVKKEEKTTSKGKKKMIEVTEVILQYSFHIETSDVALVCFPNRNINHKDSNISYLYKPFKSVFRLNTKNGKIPRTEIIVYLKDMMPLKKKMVHKKICDISLPSRYYKNEKQLLPVLNDHSNEENVKLDYSFSYDEGNQRFLLKVGKGFTIQFSNELQTILGFDKNTFSEGKYTAGKKPIINRNIHHFYVCTNIIQPIYVGGQQVRLLRYVPLPNVEYGETVYKEFLSPIYHPLSVSQLQKIDIALFDDTGEKIPFEEGRTVVTLHFRRKRK